MISDNNGRSRVLQGFTSATKELRNACSNLSPGQMVSQPEFTLMDSMAALQLMDPRMDSGISPIPLHLVANCDRLADGIQRPIFDPYKQLSAADVCWIMDRLSICELEWHKGASLSQTTHTCLYIHSLTFIDPDHPSLMQRGEASWIITRVLRPFLIAVLKSVGLVWDEMSKGNLIDGEDFNGDKAGISLLEEVDPAYAVHLMQEAIHYVRQMQQISQSQHSNGNRTLHMKDLDSLLSRLRLRKSFLECILIFAKVDPTMRLGQDLDPIEILENLPKLVSLALESMDELDQESNMTKSSILPFQTPAFSASPSLAATSTFDPWYSRRPAVQDSYNAPSAPPPPLPLQLMPVADYFFSFRSLLQGFLEVKSLVGPRSSWSQWKTFIDGKALNFQRERTMPYIRSLWQSFFCSDNNIGLRYTLDWLSDSFLLCTGGIVKNDSKLYASGMQHHTNFVSSPITTRIDDFVNRLTGQLVNHLCSLAQNRSRGKRRLASSYETLLELSMQAAAIDSSLEEYSGTRISPSLCFAPSTQMLTLDTMLHIVFSGFELELYRIEECNSAYWVAQRIAEEKIEVLKSMLKAGVGSEAKSNLLPDLEYTEAIAKACSAMQNLYIVSSIASNNDAMLPWMPEMEDLGLVNDITQNHRQMQIYDRIEPRGTDLLIEKAAFAKRFKWLRGKGRPESAQTLENLWTAFIDSAQVMEAKNLQQRLEDATSDFRSAMMSLRPPNGQSCSPLQQLLISNIQKILQACFIDEEQQSMPHSIIPLTFSHTIYHPWFPVPYAKQEQS